MRTLQIQSERNRLSLLKKDTMLVLAKFPEHKGIGGAAIHSAFADLKEDLERKRGVDTPMHNMHHFYQYYLCFTGRTYSYSI